MHRTREINVTIINESPNADKNLFLLHGYGADETDLSPISASIAKKDEYNVYTLGAPIILDMYGYSWYEIAIADDGVNREVGEDYFDSIAKVNQVIESVCDMTKTVIAGFSQGGSVALAASLEKNYLGTIGWSTYLPNNFDEKDFDLSGKKYLMSHGSIDPIVNFNLGKRTYQWLLDRNADIELIKHGGVHEIDTSTIIGSQSFLSNL
jgi:predicted esterase